jgi:transposase
MRIGTADEWVRFRAKLGNCHPVPNGAKMVSCELTRRRDGMRWSYSVSITVDMAKDVEAFATTRVVSFDWGHREHGHDRAREGIRAFTWLGDDGQSGEVLIPAECRSLLDTIDSLKSRVDSTFEARRKAHRIPERNRHSYRKRLVRAGVRTLEEADWLSWELRYERRIARARTRVLDLRKETYTRAVRELRKRYARFAFEDESGWSIRKQQTDEQMPRRKRANRDLSARYEFVSLCERFGADIITVTARNSTRECPDCGHLCENGPELLVSCPGCGTVRDKDFGACRVILRRGQEALAKRDVDA